MKKITFCLSFLFFTTALLGQKFILEEIIGEQNSNDYELSEPLDMKLENGKLTIFDKNQLLILDTLGNFIERQDAIRYSINYNKKVTDKNGTQFLVGIYKISSEMTNGQIMEKEISEVHPSSVHYSGAYRILVDDNNIYILMDKNIDIYNKNSFKFLRTIHRQVNLNNLILTEPRKIRFDKYENIYVSQESKIVKLTKSNQGYVKDTLFNSNFKYEPVWSYGIFDNKIYIQRPPKWSIFTTDLNGNNEKEWKYDSTLTDISNINVIDSTIIFSTAKSSASLFFNANGKLINKIEKDKNKKSILGWFGDFDEEGRYYNNLGSEIQIFDRNMQLIRTIGKFQKLINTQFNIGLIEKKSKLKVKLGNFKQSEFGFSHIQKCKVYKKHLFILDDSRLAIVTLDGKFVNQIINEKGTAFEKMSDFEIIGDKIYIVNSEKDKIYIFDMEL